MAGEANNTATATAEAPSGQAAATSADSGMESLQQELIQARNESMKPATPAKAADAPAKSAEGETKGEAADAPQPGSEWNQRQLDAMQSVGMTPEKVKAFGSEAKAFVDRLVNRRSENSRLASENGNLKAELQKLKSAPTGADVGKDKPADAGNQKEVAEFTVDDLDDGEKFVAKMNALVKENRQLREQQAAAATGASETQDAQQAKECDEFFTKLDAEQYGGIFGTSPMGDLAADSAEAEARNEIVELASQIQETSARKGGAISWANALDRALAVAYPQEQERVTEAKLLKKIEQRRKGNPEAPTGRQAVSASLTPEQAAERRLAEGRSRLAS